MIIIILFTVLRRSNFPQACQKAVVWEICVIQVQCTNKMQNKDPDDQQKSRDNFGKETLTES